MLLDFALLHAYILLLFNCGFVNLWLPAANNNSVVQ
jgi:hypothetical protein